MIWVRLRKSKVFVLQLINKLSVNFTAVIILIYPAISGFCIPFKVFIKQIYSAL